MLKTISAALLAVSMIATPTFAAGTGKTAPASTVKSEQAPAINGAQAKIDVKADAKTRAFNANARMRHHHHKYHKTGALKSKKNLAKVGFNGAAKTKVSKARLGKTSTHMSKIHANKSHSKVSFKHTGPVAKRG
jgi:hypothetical protein